MEPLSHDDPKLRTEGDTNLSPRRRLWREHLSSAAREILEGDDQRFLHQSLSTPCLDAIIGCQGIYLIDATGRRIMDFHGNSAHQIGYAHPSVVTAIQKQLAELSFCPRRFTNQPAVDLAEKLVTLSPASLSRVLFTPSGTAAIGIALKLARYATGRHKTISMWDSFHGASLDAISIGGQSLFRAGLGPLLPGCFHVDWPTHVDDADAIEELMNQQEDIGAVICEPVRCTTAHGPPAAYWQRVRALCDQHGAALIFDEIPLGLGRTGRMFCCEHTGVEPDILVLGKGLGGGILPMAAVIARESLNIAPDRAIGHYTHEKSPLGAAAALATIDVIQRDNLLEHAQRVGQNARQRLEQLRSTSAIIGKIRGLGLLLAVELTRDGKKATDEAERVMYDCLGNGLSFKVSDGNVLTLTPPLTITDEEMGLALTILADAIYKAETAGPLPQFD